MRLITARNGADLRDGDTAVISERTTRIMLSCDREVTGPGSAALTEVLRSCRWPGLSNVSVLQLRANYFSV